MQRGVPTPHGVEGAFVSEVLVQVEKPVLATVWLDSSIVSKWTAIEHQKADHLDDEDKERLVKLREAVERELLNGAFQFSEC